MSRAVVYETFGGPEVLELRDMPEPHAGLGEVRAPRPVANHLPVARKNRPAKDRGDHEHAVRVCATAPPSDGHETMWTSAK